MRGDASSIRCNLGESDSLEKRMKTEKKNRTKTNTFDRNNEIITPTRCIPFNVAHNINSNNIIVLPFIHSNAVSFCYEFSPTSMSPTPDNTSPNAGKTIIETRPIPARRSLCRVWYADRRISNVDEEL